MRLPRGKRKEPKLGTLRRLYQATCADCGRVSVSVEAPKIEYAGRVLRKYNWRKAARGWLCPRHAQ